MLQYLKLFSVVLLFAVFNPIVCATYGMYGERRVRASYMGSMKHSVEKRSGLKTEDTHYEEQSTNQGRNPPINNTQEPKDFILSQNIQNVFSTNFGPGLFLFENTALFNSYNDQMTGDQLTNDNKFFKVQRILDAKPGLVYNEDYVTEAEEGDIHKATDKHGKENSESRLQTNSSEKLPLPIADGSLIKDPTTHNDSEEPDPIMPTREISSHDCLEADVVNSNKSFCSHLRNYPKKDHLEDLIKKKFPNLESFFGEDFVVPQNITQRMSNAPNEEYLCRSRDRVIYPQSAQNRDWNWIYIVNSPQYRQGIRVEECLQPHATCGENTGLSLPNRFTATCEQSYIYRSLIAYYNDTVFKDTFRIPSCCKCVLRSN